MNENEVKIDKNCVKKWMKNLMKIKRKNLKKIMKIFMEILINQKLIQKTKETNWKINKTLN